MKTILHVEHDGGGGIRRHVNDLAAYLNAEGVGSLRVQPTELRILPSDPHALKIESVIDTDASCMPRLIQGHIGQSIATLKELDIFHVHIHSLLNYRELWFDELPEIIRQTGIEYDFTLHDYMVICPRIHMVDIGGIHCDVRSFKYCDRCVRMGRMPFRNVDPTAWRARYQRIIRGARRVFAPSEDVAARVRRYLGDGLPLRVRSHSERVSRVSDSRPDRLISGMRSIAIIGNLSIVKGLHVVRDLALDSLRRDVPLRFEVYGKPETDELSDYPNVVIHGEYDDNSIDGIIGASPADIALFPAVCAETYSYTLSIALRNRIFPVSFNIGAQAERIKTSGYGMVVPLDLAFDPGALNDILAEISVPRAAERGVGDGVGVVPWPGAREYYELSEL